NPPMSVRSLVVRWFVMLALAWPSIAAAGDATLTPPDEDRWHYPFNFTPGSRSSASLFTSTPGEGFDYRDAMIYIRFRTDGSGAAGVTVPAGLDPEEYAFYSVQITLYHDNASTVTWDTRPPLPVDSAGEEFRLEVFGLGISPDFSGFTLDEWTESSPFVGQ